MPMIAVTVFDASQLLNELPEPTDEELPFSSGKSGNGGTKGGCRRNRPRNCTRRNEAGCRSSIWKAPAMGGARARRLNGQRLAGANGMAPNIGDYAVGLNVTFAFMEFASIHAREALRPRPFRAPRAA